MAVFTAQEREGLYALFRLEEHEVREGATTKDKSKVQWFTYVRREAIQTRLDSLFFGEWENYFLNPAQPAIYQKDYVDCSMGLAIRGIRREYNGSQAGAGEIGAKGAATDAFKRVASLWGIGLYLQDAPTIWTENYKDANGNVDWKKKDQMEALALKKVGEWLKSIGATGKALSPVESPENASLDPDDYIPQSTLVGNDATKPIDANTRKAVEEITLPLYENNKYKQKNSLEGLLKNGMVHGNMKKEEITAVIFCHRATKEHGLHESDIFNMLGKSPVDFVQTAQAFGSAWKKLNEVVKSSKQTA